jgi:hypothetical protein
MTFKRTDTLFASITLKGKRSCVAIHQSSSLNHAVKGLISQAQKQVAIDKKSKKEANLSSKRAKTPLQKNQ